MLEDHRDRVLLTQRRMTLGQSCRHSGNAVSGFGLGRLLPERVTRTALWSYGSKPCLCDVHVGVYRDTQRG